MIDIPNNLPKDWHCIFLNELSKNYCKSLSNFLHAELLAGKKIYPPKELWFNAFLHTSLKDIRCVIIGQDPYFSKPRQAHGLAFSVPDDIAPPPSLKNIMKELSDDLGLPLPTSGNLIKWADEGVLLLNASLTVEAGYPGSHLKQGWLIFTQAIIEAINKRRENVVFLSWGAFAQRLTQNINLSKHTVINTTHPSPLGARRPSKNAPAFLGSRCFSQTNEWLKYKGIEPINWDLS